MSEGDHLDIHDAEVDGESEILLGITEADLLEDDSSDENITDDGDDKVFVSEDGEQTPVFVPIDENDLLEDESEAGTSQEILDAPSTSASSNQKKRKYNPVEKTRKRQCNTDRWEKNIQKKNVSLGQAYKSLYTNKTVPARSMKRSCALGCRYKCGSKIGDDARIVMFNEFWRIQDHSSKYDYLLRYVTESSKKSGESEKRQFSRQYSLRTLDKGEIQVCQTMFLNTLDISLQFVNTALKKRRSCDVVMKYRRGFSVRRPRETAPEDTEFVVENIKSFPRVDSHHGRSDSRREYLEECLNISIMYRLYVEETKKEGRKVVKQHVYNDISNNRFNISFFKPKKDCCDTCTNYTNATEENERTMQSDHDTHSQNKTTRRESKKADIAAAKKNESVCTACFDYQKVLTTPQTENSCLYYKRELSVMNFTVYDCGAHRGYCYCYNENEADRGSNEVGSSLYDFASKKKQEGKTEINFYCDNCGGQNKNKIVISMLLYIALSLNIKIKLTFLETGHSQNEADSVHATIERHAKMRKIYVPEEWYRIIEEAKMNGHPYEVIRITHRDIYDFKDLSSRLNWFVKVPEETKKGKTKYVPKHIPTSKIKQLLIGPELKYHLEYKTSFHEEFKTLIMRTEKNHANVGKYVLLRAYDSVQGVTDVKKKDLLALCDNNVIPPHPAAYHQFYGSIPIKPRPDPNTRIDPGGSNEISTQ